MFSFPFKLEDHFEKGNMTLKDFVRLIDYLYDYLAEYGNILVAV
jgi:hypothetical protein